MTKREKRKNMTKRKERKIPIKRMANSKKKRKKKERRRSNGRRPKAARGSHRVFVKKTSRDLQGNGRSPLLTPKSEKSGNSQYYDELTPVYTTVLSSRTLGAPTDQTLPKHCLT